MIIKRFIFIGLLLLITVGAHLSNDHIYNFLHTSGLDLPLTPFTADMTLMLEKKTKAYYTRNYLVRYEADKELHDLKIEDMGWYEFKAPFQWLSECQQKKNQCAKIHYYMCKSLNDHTGRQVKGWKIVEIGNQVPDDLAGIGVYFPCHS